MERDVVLCGDALAVLRELPSESVQCVVTSPPYFGLRDYGTATWEGGHEDCDHAPRRNHKPTEKQATQQGSSRDKITRTCGKCGATRIDQQIGLEETPEQYVARLVAVFREVRRVLRRDGTCWVNMGDSYAGGDRGRKDVARMYASDHAGIHHHSSNKVPHGLKPKDLIGVPWMLAFALRADGWWLRSDIVWHKPNPMPESVTDRPTRSHEYIFLLSKSATYYYDGAAIREDPKPSSIARISQPTFAQQTGGPKDYANGTNSNRSMRRTLEHWADSGRVVDKQRGHSRRHAGFNDRWDAMEKAQQQQYGANKRDVWTVATKPYPEAHFATFPPTLIEPCILAGSRPGDVVLDPFAGSGTTCAVAKRHSRHWLGVDLNPAYVALAEQRIARELQPVLWSATADLTVA